MSNIWKKLKSPILALAPMAGYTDSAFRLLCLEYGADVVYTEMISAEALARKNKKTLKMLEFLPEEKNVTVQLFGTNPVAFAKATKIINQLPITHYPLLITGIDINLGCPARKIYSAGAGAALMNNKKLAREIIKAVSKNTNLPVSIKIRSRVKNTTAEKFVNFIKDLPISAVMTHGRSLKQEFSGPIDFEMIKKIKKLLPDSVVLANGGINSPEDAKEMVEKTGADGIGIGRGALGRPWIFSLCHPDDHDFSRGRKDLMVNWQFIKKQMLTHARLFLKQNNNLIPLRKHLVHYVKGIKNASELRQKIVKIKNLSDLKDILK